MSIARKGGSIPISVLPTQQRSSVEKPGLTPETVRLLGGWSAFYQRWRAFADTATPTFGSANQWDLSQQYAKDLQDWQAAVAAVCGALGVPTVKTTDDPEKRFDLGSTVKWTAAAIIAVSTVYGISKFAKTKGWIGA